jgi:uncharacterized membrane protein
MQTFKSDLSQKNFPLADKIPANTLRASIFALIQAENPTFDRTACLSKTELNVYREKYISSFLTKEMGTLSQLEQTVLDSLNDKTLITDKVEEEPQDFTFGQRVADKVATFGGSWTFILSFGFFIFVWITMNIVLFSNTGFDPYPFILLNLLLSCLAALQAPVIMMSQNRQEEKDRERSKQDYMINLKSELEIRILHEKIDHLIMHQQQELLEIQKVQIEMMHDILNQLDTQKGKV